jgi:DNA-binding CsgD family transcriptional regulator
VGVNVSVREPACPRWLAHGKFSWDIDGTLEISENRVNYPIKDAMSKLVPTARTLASIKAVQLGTIHSPSEPELSDVSRLRLHPASASRGRWAARESSVV